MIADKNMKEFLDVLASKEPVPGGGGASAYVAAIGMCLGTMVANLTSKKKKYAQYQEEIDTLLIKTDKLTKELVICMDKDAEAFEPLSKAYGLPKSTPQEASERDKVMEKALLEASEAPLELMEKIIESMQLLSRLAVIGSRLAISDVGVGIQMAKAALNGASLNVFINTKLMKNEEVADQLNLRADQMLISGNELADSIFDNVMDDIR